MGDAADRHLPFLHCLEQCALHLRRRAVDLVGKHQVGKDRSVMRCEASIGRRIDHRADEERRDREQRRDRDRRAEQRDGHSLRQRLNQKRFGQTWHAFQQHVSAGDQSNLKPLNHRRLTQHGLADLY